MLYLGAHGISHGLTSAADAAAKLQDLPHIRSAFVGEGAAKLPRDPARCPAVLDLHPLDDLRVPWWGRAVIGALRGEPARILQQAGAVVVEPEQPELLADAIRQLAEDPERRAAMGAEGRQHVEAEFDRRQLAAQYTVIFDAIMERST